MKYLIITAFIFTFAQNVLAEEALEDNLVIVEESSASEAGHVIVSRLDEDTDPEISTQKSYSDANIEFSDANYYEFADGPDYEPKNRILLGGIVPFIPIRSSISASAEDTGFLQKSVSFLVYFKQNF